MRLVDLVQALLHVVPRHTVAVHEPRCFLVEQQPHHLIRFLAANLAPRGRVPVCEKTAVHQVHCEVGVRVLNVGHLFLGLLGLLCLLCLGGRRVGRPRVLLVVVRAVRNGLAVLAKVVPPALLVWLQGEIRPGPVVPTVARRRRLFEQGP